MGEIKKRENNAGRKALELVTKWKNEFRSKDQNSAKDVKNQKNINDKDRTSKKSEAEKRKDKPSGNLSSSFSKTPDHWKDVSLNLLGEQSRKVKKKKKVKDLSKTSPEKIKQENKTEVSLIFNSFLSY